MDRHPVTCTTLPAPLCCAVQNAAAAASDNPEAASNALTLYDYKQQQVISTCRNSPPGPTQLVVQHRRLWSERFCCLQRTSHSHGLCRCCSCVTGAGRHWCAPRPGCRAAQGAHDRIHQPHTQPAGTGHKGAAPHQLQVRRAGSSCGGARGFAIAGADGRSCRGERVRHGKRDSLCASCGLQVPNL